MRKYKRIAASCMAAALASMSLAAPAAAAAPQVQVDETMYVNLDYYGKETKINVVKGLNTNGQTSHTDYGVYDKVVNMSDQTEPVLGDGSVSWQFPGENKRFYYQCTMQPGAVELPWSFDVTYKLNGTEMDAAKLAGASGLVEIHVDAVPNRRAKAYYRNNMTLSVVFPVDMAKCYSVDAPGSQMQSMGGSTAAVFLALPGEKGDFTIRIGTDSFESAGAFMMMVPATASAFDNIKELKEAKDTWRESGDAMYNSMDELLQTMESMRTDVTRLKGGLDSLQGARSQVSQNRKSLEALSTQAIADLKSVTDQTTVLIPYLETARSAITDINDNVDAIYNTMEDTQDELDTLYDRLKSLSRSMEYMSDEISRGITEAERKALGQEIQSQAAEIQAILAGLGQLLGTGANTYNLAAADLEELEGSLEKADSFRYDRRSGETETEENTDAPEAGSGSGSSDAEAGASGSETDSSEAVTGEKSGSAGAGETGNAGEAEETGTAGKAGNAGETEETGTAGKAGNAGEAEETDTAGAAAEKQDSDPEGVGESDVAAFGAEVETGALEILTLGGPSGEPGSGGENDADFEEWSDEELDEYADSVEADLQTLSGTSYPAQVGELLEKLSQTIGAGEQLTQAVDGVIREINEVCLSAGDASHDTARTLSALKNVTDELVNLLDDSRVLIDTMDGYVPSMLDSLGATEELMNRLTNAMGDTYAFLSLVNETVIAAGNGLDAGTRDSLDGMMALLDKSLTMLDHTAAIREAGSGMKDTLDGQLDKFEDENSFLNIDPENALVSFTSGKNASPHSLQIVVRTDEISIDEGAAQIADLEDAEREDLGPFERMWRVIVKIFQAVVEIFRER